MTYILAWGNNLTGNLDPRSGDSIISTPRHVLPDLAVEEIVWSSWASTIGRVGDDYYTWGSGMPGDTERVPTKLAHHARPVKFLGADEATAYLDRDGHVHELANAGMKSSRRWGDVVVTDLDTVYAISLEKESTARICRFTTFEDFMSDTNPTPVPHPLFDTSSTLHTTESRVFAQCSGQLRHLLEIDGENIRLIEDLEGMGVESVIPGSGNRLAVITEAGDAYLIDRRSIEPELLEVGDESAVRFVGVGSKHEVVVTEENVWVRGENSFSQLGIEGGSQEEFVRLQYFDGKMVKRIKSVHCGRWSTIVVMHDS